MTLKILKITDGRAGHITITDGVIESIKQNYDVEIVQLNIKLRFKILLQFFKYLINYTWFDCLLKKNRNILKFFYKNLDFPKQHIDIIISTGGDTSFINIWLSRCLKVKNIYCSQLRGLNPRYFHLIISRTDLGIQNSIYMEVAPTGINSNNINTIIEVFCSKNYLKKEDKYFALLIGGDGGGYKYDEDDYYELVNNFMSSIKKHKAKALITTSRRTGEKYEKLLKELFSKYSDDIAYIVYFGQNPEKVVSIYLELSSTVFVTEESGSMISESLFCKKPVFTLSPKVIKEQKRYKLFLDDLANKKRIARINMREDLLNLDIDNFVFNYIEKLPIDDLSEKLQPFLKEIV